MAQLTLPYTLVAGTPENINNVQSNFVQIRDHINTALIGDDNLTSPNNTVPRTVFAIGGCLVGGGAVAGTYALLGDCSTGLVSGTPGRAPLWHPVSADLAVAGKTTQVRVRADVVVNATAPGVNFTLGLYPISASAGGAGVLTMTLGAVVATALFTTPSASVPARTEGSYVTLPAAGSYLLAVVLSGTAAANTVVSLSAAVEMRHV